MQLSKLEYARIKVNSCDDPLSVKLQVFFKYEGSEVEMEPISILRIDSGDELKIDIYKPHYFSTLNRKRGGSVMVQDKVNFRGSIDYEAGTATLQRSRYEPDNQWDDLGALELCIVWMSVRDKLRSLTGKEPQDFIAELGGWRPMRISETEEDE